MCEFEYIVCTKIFPTYTPLSLGQTYLDIIMPIMEWYLSTKGGAVKPSNGDLVIGGKTFKKVSADQVSWL